MNKPLNKKYISEIDIFLNDLRERLPESDSQKKERKKHATIDALRDGIISNKPTHESLKNF